MRKLIAVALVLAAALAQAVEYKVVRCHWATVTPAARTELLNKEALDGWRLVEVSAYQNGAEIDLYLVREEGSK